MPVSIRSRYFTLPGGKESVALGGQDATFLPMRPQPPASTNNAAFRLSADDTLESLAARYYGRSDAWWFIADANPNVFALDWRPGQGLNLPQATGLGRVLRTRRF